MSDLVMDLHLGKNPKGSCLLTWKMYPGERMPKGKLSCGS